jgi:hypothetical protein
MKDPTELLQVSLTAPGKEIEVFFFSFEKFPEQFLGPVTLCLLPKAQSNPPLSAREVYSILKQNFILSVSFLPKLFAK